MGLSLRPENTPVHLTAGVEASNISDKYYEPPLMQVIPSACEACEEKGYEVSNMCKGCLAHPCMEVRSEERRVGKEWRARLTPRRRRRDSSRGAGASWREEK